MMAEILLQSGDLFATSNPQGLGKVICIAECAKSLDGEAEYGHSGIIQDPLGKTFEAVWHIAEQNLFDAYKGQKTIIARWRGMNEATYRIGFDAVYPLLGRHYPFQRLLLHMVGLARWVHVLDTPVCSELTAKFLINCGAIMLSDKEFWGITPDNLVDEWRISKYFDVILKGQFKGGSYEKVSCEFNVHSVFIWMCKSRHSVKTKCGSGLVTVCGIRGGLQGCYANRE